MSAEMSVVVFFLYEASDVSGPQSASLRTFNSGLPGAANRSIPGLSAEPVRRHTLRQAALVTAKAVLDEQVEHLRAPVIVRSA
jgi:hypothetical protein